MRLTRRTTDVVAQAFAKLEELTHLLTRIADERGLSTPRQAGRMVADLLGEKPRSVA